MTVTYPIASFSTTGGVPIGGVDLNQKCVDPINDLAVRVGVRAGGRWRRVANQSLTSGSVAAISWDTEDEDTNGFLAVTSTTVTIPAGYDGVYAITARQILSATPGVGRAFLEVNVTSSLTGLTTDFRFPNINGNEAGRIVAPVTIPLAAGDTFLINSLQTSGGALNLTALLTVYRTSA